MTGYWDRLQHIIDVARSLQASPIPESETEQLANLQLLTNVEVGIEAS